MVPKNTSLPRRKRWQNSKLDVRARKAAEAVGLKARRSYWRLGSKTNHGGFLLTDPQTHRVVAGEHYNLTPGDVIRICAELA
ncbi:MAG: hypothetical protein AAGE43_13345 [Pseudomonadota bacterium]